VLNTTPQSLVPIYHYIYVDRISNISCFQKFTSYTFVIQEDEDEGTWGGFQNGTWPVLCVQR